jgi:hypothetical protein
MTYKPCFFYSHTTTSAQKTWVIPKWMGFLSTTQPVSKQASKQGILHQTPARWPLLPLTSDSVYLRWSHSPQVESCPQDITTPILDADHKPQIVLPVSLTNGLSMHWCSWEFTVAPWDPMAHNLGVMALWKGSGGTQPRHPSTRWWSLESNL